QRRERVDHHPGLAGASHGADPRPDAVLLDHDDERLVAVLELRQEAPHEALGQLAGAEPGRVGQAAVHDDLGSVGEEVAPLLVVLAAGLPWLLCHSYPFTPPAVCWPVREFWNE